tara:strand:+ start:2294 stop:3139 length:846 start_codon:yes stop_codon:yes gene_type:complete
MINWLIKKPSCTILCNEIFYNKDKSISCEIIIPEVVNNAKVKTIGIWHSGGIDSTMLLYLLAKIIKDNKLDINIQPATVGIDSSNKSNLLKYLKQWHTALIENQDVSKIIANLEGHNLSNYITGPMHSKATIDKISKLLDIDFILPQIVSFADLTLKSVWNGYFDTEKENIKNGVWNILYTGRNAVPPDELFDRSPFHEMIPFWESREPGVVHETISDDGSESKPFSNVDKKFIAELYEQYNLLDELFPLTKSCFDPYVNGTKGCGKCFHCFEKQYGFGEY